LKRLRKNRKRQLRAFHPFRLKIVSNSVTTQSDPGASRAHKNVGAKIGLARMNGKCHDPVRCRRIIVKLKKKKKEKKKKIKKKKTEQTATLICLLRFASYVQITHFVQTRSHKLCSFFAF
jgi:hypothetical protein